MLFQLTPSERDRFDDLLYELRHAGYKAEVYFTVDDATIEATKGKERVDVRFTRPSRGGHWHVAGTIAVPGKKPVQVDRVVPIITHVQLNHRDEQAVERAASRLKQHYKGDL